MMAWPDNDALKANLVAAGYTQDLNTALVYFLRTALGTSYGTFNDLLFAYLGTLGYVGSLNDRIRQWDGILGPGGVADALLLEDGTYGLLLEDGTSYLLLES